MATRDDIVAALRHCYDPCCRDRQISVVDMGLIEDVVVDGADVRIDMVLTTGWCPFVANLSQMIIGEVSSVEGVGTVDVRVVWDPVWTMDRLAESARKKLTIPLEPLIPYRERRLAEERSLTT